MGRWQREYERTWRDYTRQVINDYVVAKHTKPCFVSVKQADEHQLRTVLAAEGIAHVPPNHSRWRALTPASLSDAQDSSLVLEESYVYSTPPLPDVQGMCRSLSSQEFGSQSTPGRCVSPSQRLQVRTADMSPIADHRRTSIECAGTISLSLGAARSPWTPEQWSPKRVGKTRRTPRRSLESNFRGEGLDVSIETVHLGENAESRTSYEEMEDTQMVDVSEVSDEEEKAAVAQVKDCENDADQEQDIDRVEVAVHEHDSVQCPMVEHRDEVKDMNVSKELILGSDSEDDEYGKKEETKKQIDGDALVRKKQVSADTPLVHGSPLPEILPERPASAIDSDVDCIETENDYNSEYQPSEVLGAAQPVAEKAPCFSGAIHAVGGPTEEDASILAKQQDFFAQTTRIWTNSSIKSNSVARQHQSMTTRRSTFSLPAVSSSLKRTLYACPRASSARQTSCTTRAFAPPTALSTRPTTLVSSTTSLARNALSASLAPIQAAQASPTTPASLKSALSWKRANRGALSRRRANRGALLRTKLPLQMEYRFASDQRRRHRRQKSLAAKPGKLPYVVPELLVELQPYQKKALEWMLEREEGPVGPITLDHGEATAVDALVAKVCGGVLVDEMGLTKTVCCLALICGSLRQARAADAQARRETGSTVPRLTPPTLIVAPLSILAQWKQEIRAKTNLSVVMYQGATRKSFWSATQFMEADVVLSTYDTLRLSECTVQDRDSDHDGDEVNGDGTGAEDVWDQAPRLPPCSKKAVASSNLHQLQWFRIILDASHLIANASCGRAQAAFTLSSKRRWCVTGTPIQNGTTDLAAMLQFVGLGNRAHTLSERELGMLVPRVVLRRLKSTVDTHQELLF